MVEFDVVGVPAPQGSKRGFVNRHSGKVAMVESSSERVKTWRADVREAALVATQNNRPIITGPVGVTIEFRIARPKGHYGTGRNAEALKATAPAHPAGKPDLDKLVRATLDALTGIVFVDDAQVVLILGTKVYGTPGARILVDALPALHADVLI